MIVFSPLSLYTTYLGWQQYDVLFDAMWQTGLLYIGFFKAGYQFLKNTLVPAGSTHQASEHALNHFLYDIAILFVVCAVFLYPSIPLEQKGLSFKPVCTLKKDSSISESKIGDTGTTYDETFADMLAKDVKIPLGFSILQNIASSFTYGVMKVTGCTDSLQSIQGALVSTHVPEDVRHQAILFHRQCFLEARTNYRSETHTEAEKTRINEILKRHGGEEDLNWLGSKTYSTLYYGKLRAREPVAGFPYAQYPNPNFENAKNDDETVREHLPENGYPTCNQWWSRLQSDLVKASENAGMFDRHIGGMAVRERVFNYKMKHRLVWNSDITPDEYVAKVLLSNSQDMQTQSAESLIDPTNSRLGTFLSRNLINVGQKIKSVTSAPLKREALVQTLPILHAFFYFFLILLTPIVIGLSGCSMAALGSLFGLYGMGIFVQCIWHYTGFLERSAIDVLGDSEIVDAMRNMALLFYFAAPLLLLKLSSHFGGMAGSGLGELINATQQGSNDATKSGKDVVSIGAKALRGGF